MNAAANAVTNTEIAVRIRAEHEAAQASAREAVAHAIRAGELLIEAKAALQHGQFGPWLAANVAFSERTARGYMRLAGLDEAKRQRVADMSLRGALRSLAAPVDLRPFSRDELTTMSRPELDQYRRHSLEVAAKHMQSILDERDIPDATGMPHALKCITDCKRMLVDIGAASPPGQLPLALMLMAQCNEIRAMLAGAS